MSKNQALDNLTKTQSTKAFQELTSDWRKVNGEIIKPKEELWKPIQGADGLYEISNTGRVRSWNQRGHNRKRVRDSPIYLTNCIDDVGYYSCSIVQYGKWVKKENTQIVGHILYRKSQ